MNGNLTFFVEMTRKDTGLRIAVASRLIKDFNEVKEGGCLIDFVDGTVLEISESYETLLETIGRVIRAERYLQENKT